MDTRTRIRVIGVNLSEILIKGNKMQFELTRNSIYPSSSYPSKMTEEWKSVVWIDGLASSTCHLRCTSGQHCWFPALCDFLSLTVLTSSKSKLTPLCMLMVPSSTVLLCRGPADKVSPFIIYPLITVFCAFLSDFTV